MCSVDTGQSLCVMPFQYSMYSTGYFCKIYSVQCHERHNAVETGDTSLCVTVYDISTVQSGDTSLCVWSNRASAVIASSPPSGNAGFPKSGPTRARAKDETDYIYFGGFL